MPAVIAVLCGASPFDKIICSYSLDMCFETTFSTGLGRLCVKFQMSVCKCNK